MNFDFNEEQYAFRDSVRGFLGDRPAGVGGALPWAGESARQLWSGIAELGVFSALVPEEFGGLGLTFVDLALVLEEFGRALVPPSVVETLVATDAIVRHGSADQKQSMLPRIATGQLRLACAIIEQVAGYDMAEMGTAVVSDGRDYRLDGSKILVPEAANADFLLVAAGFGGGRGNGLVFVERTHSGVELREQRTLDPASAYHEAVFRHVAIPRENILSGEPSSDALQRLFNASATAAGALMTGVAGKVLETSVEYVKQRSQFGKLIGSFQAIKHRCADMAVAVDSSRSAAYYAAWSLASGAADLTKAVSIAKSFCGDTARFVCNEGIQVHGGIGFTWDLGLHFYLRRAKLLEYSYGDSTYHRERVIREALRELGTAD
jgi:alkylation response protein AidB-like acyl-CoA dehydrogenase